jgi:hypothetical protein
MILVSSSKSTREDGDDQIESPHLAGISIIERVHQYQYLEMGPQSYMTLVIPVKRSAMDDDDVARGCLQGGYGLC